MVATRRLARLRTDIDERLDLPAPPRVVALSGGADSAALAAVSGPVRLIHVHHGRPHSDRMQQAAESIAQVLKVPFKVEEVEIERWSEGAARGRRYELLLGSLREGETLLTGHTLDDQAETVLANILRGTGSEGLHGIPRLRDRIARPLLDVTRSETRELATLSGLPWEDDPTNDDLDPLRNRIRHRLLPMLEAEYNPAIRSALVGLAAGFRPRDRDLDLGELTSDGWRIANSRLWAAGFEAAADVLRSALRPLHGGYGLDRSETRQVWDVVIGERGATELRGGLRVERVGPWLVCRSLPLPPTR
ncbi:MAG: tRNA lysidine(34) synthetase TilS [Acidimicrobiia bacterium]